MRSLDEIAAEIDALDGLLQPHLAQLKKFQSLLAGAKKKISDSECASQDLKKLVSELRKLTEFFTEASKDSKWIARTETFCNDVSTGIPAIEDAAKKAFWPQVENAANKAGIACGRLGSKEYLDTFELEADLSRNVATLIYAKHAAVSVLPMKPAVVVDEAKKFGERIRSWESQSTPEELGKRFDEAMSVSLVRERKSAQGDQKRVPLPALFREMQLLLQYRTKPGSTDMSHEYPLPRFIVELRALVTSEWNANSVRRFDLEPAVIENAGNWAKAVFIPESIGAGYGEGKWWQALRVQ
jgi:hypothetical protein